MSIDTMQNLQRFSMLYNMYKKTERRKIEFSLLIEICMAMILHFAFF
jgi:hypothetical protein